MEIVKLVPCSCPAGVVVAQMMQQQGVKLPYLAVPRPVKTEVELLRELVETMKGQIAALTPPPAPPAASPFSRAIARWPGGVGFIQGIRWRSPL
jgi:exoribonuclease R